MTPKITAARRMLTEFIEVSSSMESGKAMELLNGTTAKSLKENGGMVRKMDLASGSPQKETSMKEIGC